MNNRESCLNYLEKENEAENKLANRKARKKRLIKHNAPEEIIAKENDLLAKTLEEINQERFIISYIMAKLENAK